MIDFSIDGDIFPLAIALVVLYMYRGMHYGSAHFLTVQG